MRTWEMPSESSRQMQQRLSLAIRGHRFNAEDSFRSWGCSDDVIALSGQRQRFLEGLMLPAHLFEEFKDS